MKLIIKISLLIALLSFGCVPDDDSVVATSFHKVSTVAVPANIPYIKDVSDGAKVAIGLLGKSEAKDIKSVSLLATFVPNGGTPGTDSDENILDVTTYPDTVVIAESDLLALAGKSDVDDLIAGDRWIITYKVFLKNGETLTNGVKTNITFTCQSDLAGKYDFSTTSIVSGDGTDVSGCGTEMTGSGTLTQVSGGVYSFTDNTFGMFDCAYGVASSAGTLTISDLCGKISWDGKDQYGDTYTMTITGVTGTTLTFDWHNTYGDSGTTTLTRTDSKTWPAGLYTE